MLILLSFACMHVMAITQGIKHAQMVSYPALILLLLAVIGITIFIFYQPLASRFGFVNHKRT